VKPILVLLLSLNLSLNLIQPTGMQSLPEWGGSPETDNPDTVFDGFWWHGAWVPGYITLDYWLQPTPELYWGRAVYYAPGVMEATANYHSLSLKGYVDGVASMACGDIGEDVWLQGPLGWEGPFLVVDCPMRGDAYGIIVFRKESIEVGWKTAQRWGMNKYNTTISPVVVSKIHPACLPHNAQADPLVLLWLPGFENTLGEDIVSPWYDAGRWYHRAWRTGAGGPDDGYRTYPLVDGVCEDWRMDRWELRYYVSKR
jgi:hypothetical protein